MGMVTCNVGSVPRTDRLGNGPYIGIEPHCYPVVHFRITNWDTRNVSHHGFQDACVVLDKVIENRYPG